MTLPSSLPATFIAKAQPVDCIAWTGALNAKGYGVYGVDGVGRLAHRVAYEAAYGLIPSGMQIDHTCGFHRCVNPAHLELVTNAENMARRAERIKFCDEGHELTERWGEKRCPVCAPRTQRRAGRRYYGRKTGALVPPHIIREWAIEVGYPISARGDISSAIRNAYAAAHTKASA